MNLDNKKPGRKPLYVYYIIAAVIIILLNVLLLPAIEGRKVQTTDYSTFLTGVEKDYVKTVEIQDDYIYYVAESDGQEGYFRTVKMNDPDLVDRLHDANVKFGAAAPQQTSIWISLIAGYVLPIAIFILLGRWLSKKMMSSMGGGPGGAMSFGKSNAKVYVKSSTGIKFSDVAGEDEAKDLLTEIVDYLHNPQKYREIGASMPKGALLVGPPGTGKTLLAKAVAGEAEVPFFSISGSEFVEMFVGMGAAKVRDLFKQANEKAPCIVFIDEIDTIGKKRDGAGFTGGNDEREQTLNQLLTEMDGFDGSKGVVILAATNRPDSLDPALLRPGRFDRQITVNYPDIKGREDILKVHARGKPFEQDVNLHTLAQTTVGFTGADLANLLNEAALLAARKGKSLIGMDDLEDATIKVIVGPQKKSKVISEKEKRLTAYHEAGHAIVGELLGGGAGEEVVAAGLRLARGVTPAVGDAFRVGDGLHRGDQVPHPRRVPPVRVRDAFGVERPYPAVRMVEPADRGGHVEDIALVRGRQARARCREHGRDRVAQGLAGTRARQNDSHVLPAGVHRRVVHDVEPQRIARRHALAPVVRFYEP